MNCSLRPPSLALTEDPHKAIAVMRRELRRPITLALTYPIISKHVRRPRCCGVNGSLQLRVLGLGLFQDRDVGIGVLPQGVELFARGELPHSLTVASASS